MKRARPWIVLWVLAILCGIAIDTGLLRIGLGKTALDWNLTSFRKAELNRPFTKEEIERATQGTR